MKQGSPLGEVMKRMRKIQSDKFLAKNNSALHMAAFEGNSKCVNLILQHMTMTKQVPIKNFTEIIGQLVEYKNFLPFLEKLPFKTQALSMKNVLKVKTTLSEDIVQMQESYTTFIDDNFFNKRNTL